MGGLMVKFASYLEVVSLGSLGVVLMGSLGVGWVHYSGKVLVSGWVEE